MKDKQKEKMNIVLKKDTIKLLNEIAKMKLNQAMREGSFDIINLIRSKRSSGISYDRQINFLARIYLAIVEQKVLLKGLAKTTPQLKKILDDLNNITRKYNFFIECGNKDKK